MTPRDQNRPPLLRPILRNPRIHTLIVVVGGVGTQKPESWTIASGQRTQRKLWIEDIPDLKSPDIGVFEFDHGITPSSLSWLELLQNGAVFSTELNRLITESRLDYCPIFIIAHSLGGLIVKEALCSAYHEGYTTLIRAMAGVILLGTPHCKVEDRTIWQNAGFAVPKAPKKVRSMSDDDVTTLARSSLRFEQASVQVPILSGYETKETKIRNIFLFLSKTVLIMTMDFVKTESHSETLLAIDSDHNGLCNMDVQSSYFQTICNFVQESIEACRLRIIQGTPNFGLPSTLDGWSVVEHEYSSGGKSGPSTEARLNAVSLSGRRSLPTTSGPSDTEFEIINPNHLSFERITPHLTSCFIVPVTQNRNFIGREGILREIDQVFMPSGNTQLGPIPHEPRTYALCGPGGIGKTQIAAEYVHTRRDKFKAVFWIHADSSSKVREEFKSLAVRLNLIDENSIDARDYVISRDMVKGWLAEPEKAMHPTQTTPSWLLVVDNLDDTGVLSDIWPLYGPGCVLFTSRDTFAKNEIIGCADTGTDVPPLNEKESASLLGKLTRKDGDSSGVHDRLGGIPLAITQMASVIIRQNLTYTEFVESYDRQKDRRELFQLSFDRRNIYKKTLWSVWALESLKSGRPLLNVLSMFDPDGVPEYIFRNITADLKLPPSFPQTAKAYQKARTELFQTSLITRDSTAQKILIHRLIQDAAYVKMNTEEYNSSFESALKLLSSVWPHESFEWRHGVQRWKVCEQLFQSVLSLRHAAERLPERGSTLSTEGINIDITLLRLLTDAAWYYHEIGFSLEAKPLLMYAYGLCKNLRRLVNDEEHAALVTKESQTVASIDHITGEIHHNLGCIGTETNEPSFTLEHFKMFNEMMIRESGNQIHGKDKRLSISWNELGNAYMMNKMWTEGRDCFQKSITAAREQANFEITDLSFPHVNLGLAWWLMGQHDDAIKVLITGLSDRQKVYGLDDKQSFITGRFLFAIGNVLKSQGCLEESFTYHLRALAQYEGTIGKNHHRTGDAHVKVAEHLLQQARLDEARKHLQEAMRIFGDRPEYRPEKARVLYKISQVLRATGEIEKAEEILHQAGDIYNQMLPSGSHKLAESLVDHDMDDIIMFWSR